MKKNLFVCLMCLFVCGSVNAERCAVFGFRAGVGVTQSDVDGIFALFKLHFHPEGYTFVDSQRIEEEIENQGFDKANLTDNQMLGVGELLNVEKIVIGDINLVMGQYNIDVRILDVQTEAQEAMEGAALTPSTYRESIIDISERLMGEQTDPKDDQAADVVVAPVVVSEVQPVVEQNTVSEEPAVSQQPNNVDELLAKYEQKGEQVVDNEPVEELPVEEEPIAEEPEEEETQLQVLLGYLKVFPEDMGTFDSWPRNVIGKLNKQQPFGYGSWRLPTNEELQLLKANKIVGNGTYMTRESKKGIVRLVCDGPKGVVLPAIPVGYVDLGLASGTLWKSANEDGGYYTYEQAKAKFGNDLPTVEQWRELKNACKWLWVGSGYKVEGPNGSFIVLPAVGIVDCENGRDGIGTHGYYWSSSLNDVNGAWDIGFSAENVSIGYDGLCYGQSVRLVQ